MSAADDKLAREEEFERLRRFQEDYLNSITAEIQAAAGSTMVRRAEPTPLYSGNRQQRRAAARKDRP